jgi:exosortase/archaeosortase family protein
MEGSAAMSGTKRLVLIAAFVLLAIWTVFNFGRLTGDQDGPIRFVLGAFFAAAILIRTRSMSEEPPRVPGFAVPALTAIGMLLVTVFGIVFEVRQLDWLGIILMLGGCLLWTVPPEKTRNILPSLLLLYWVHPLPGRVFGQFQLMMQTLSVKGAELVLHCANIHVWADGLVLRTGFHAFGVPESCSGMRTAVTVLLCTLGVGMLFRFRWYEHLLFLLAGLAQVLLINIARISGMVLWAPRMPKEWADNFLHDTLGIFLLVSILAVQLEASAWRFVRERRRRRQLGVERGHIEHPDRASTLPRFFRVALVGTAVLVLLGAIGAVAFLVAYKHRPQHRGAMIACVAEELLENDANAAGDAAQVALRLLPKERSIHQNRILALLRTNRFEDALKAFGQLPGGMDVRDTMLKSWALMALKKDEDAIALVNALTPEQQRIPGVAMVKAEYEARRGHPQESARNVVLAAPQSFLISRARALFPYLARHEQWKAIADCDNPTPFKDSSQALLSVLANLKMNDLTAAAAVLQDALERWPNNPLYLGPLFTLAVKRPGGPWEGMFAANLKANIANLDADLLSDYMGYAFQLTRPDLAWMSYQRLRELDPDDPGLALTLARHIGSWFTFRRQQLGLVSASAQEQIDLQYFCMLTRNLPPFQAFWSKIPLVDEMLGKPANEIRRASLSQCLAELQKREQEQRLTLRMEMMYPTALAMQGHFDEAHRRLDAIAVKHPDQKAQVLLQHAVFYDLQGQWQDSYEILLAFREKQETPPMSSELLRINAMMNMGMGMVALEVATAAQHEYPDNQEVAMARAGIWDAFGFKEEALFDLSKVQTENRLGALARLLYDTGRIHEAEKMSRVYGIRLTRRPEKEKQWLAPLPAELTISRGFPPPLTAEEMTAEAVKADAALATAKSPFIRAMGTIEREWYRSQGAGNTSTMARWEAVGRDNLEKATALHRLCVLLARQKRDEEAGQAVVRAVELFPKSAILRRIQVMLAGGDRAVVDAACLACPDDPDLMLAGLVARCKAEKPGSWMNEYIRKASEGDRFPPAAIVRAGDFAVRVRQFDAAETAARYAQNKGQGYLPAYGLAIKCAIEKKDMQWALSACLSGVENAVDPAPFYAAIVEIKASGRSPDADMIAALEFLRTNKPQEKQWAERLGQICFMRGEMDRALSVLSPLIHADAKGVRVQSLIMAAEAARMEGVPARSLAILEDAYSRYTDKLSVLNNLVYNLAQNPATLGRARQLLPELIQKGKDNFVVMDTIAMVYLRSGELKRAQEYMDGAVKKLDKKNYAASEIMLNSAEILLQGGELKEARKRAESVRGTADCPATLDLRARRLLDRINDAEQRK